MAASLLEKILCFLADLIGFGLVFCFMFWFQFYSGYVPESFDPAKDYIASINPLIIHSIAWLGLFLLTGLYIRIYLIQNKGGWVLCSQVL